MTESTTGVCVECGQPVRPRPADDAEWAWTRMESWTDAVHYCQACFDAMGEPVDEEADDA